MTATALLLPPAATATPTVSPTPVIHTVESGESLYSIAFDYEVSPDLLQQVNGIEDPQFLSIGQELIIPVGQASGESTTNLLLPTPLPMAFSVSGIAFYETPVGSLWCLGEAVNTTSVTLANVQVNVALYSEAGEVLVQADAFAAADLIPPGGRSPFGILFTDPPREWASPQVTIIRGEEAGGLEASYVPIEVDSHEGQAEDVQFRVTGLVRNASPDETAGKVYVIVTTYDDQGLVTGFRHGAVDVGGGLLPGDTAPFSALLAYHGSAPADYAVVGLGRVLVE
jgi:LysM repeat protein